MKVVRDRAPSDDTWQVCNTEYGRLDKEIKKSCKRDKRTWIEEKGREAEEAADRNDSRTLQNRQRSDWHNRQECPN